MQNIDKKILERIAKMLRLAENSAATPEEAATAAAMAANLMRKHGIEHADDIKLELQQEDDSVVSEWVQDSFDHTARGYPKWMGILTTAVAHHFDCHARMLYSGKFSASRTPYVSVKLYGYKTDVKVASWTISYLVRTTLRLADEWAARTSAGRTEKMSYRLGMAIGIHDQLKKQVEEVRERGLVVAKEAAIAQKFGEFSYSRRASKVHDAFAYAAGHREGSKLSINRPLESNDDQAKPVALPAH